MTNDNRARDARRGARVGWAMAVVALLALAGCSRMPWKHEPVAPAPVDTAKPKSVPRACAMPVRRRPRGPNHWWPSRPTPSPIQPPRTRREIGRLVRFAGVWHTIALHHPWVATRGVPWDSALIIAAPRVRGAADDASLVQAYRKMFAVLRDPRTRVELAIPAPSPVAVATERIVDSIVVVRIAPSAALDASDSTTVAGMVTGLSARLILDLRGSPVDDGVSHAARIDAFMARTGLTGQLIAGTIIAPVERTRRIGVWPTVDDARAASVVHDGWYQPVARSYTGHGDADRRIIVLADSGTVLPGAVLALLDASRASLVADGALRDAAPVSTARIPLGNGFVATIRVGELVHADGSVDVSADTVIQHSGSVDDAFNAALTMLRCAGAPPAGRATPAVVHATRGDAGVL